MQDQNYDYGEEVMEPAETADARPLIITVPETMDGVRLDAFLSQALDSMSRSFLKSRIEEGCVKLASTDAPLRKGSRRMKAGECVTVDIPKPEEPDILPEDIALDILYEDSDVIVVNKPKNMVVHPAPGHYTGTLVNALMYHCRDSLSGINGSLRPGIVHRIDKDTTGAIVACKNDRAHQSLALQLKEHSITRRYRAIVHGNLPQDEGRIDAPIGRHPRDRLKMAVLSRGEGSAREAVTNYRVLQRFGNYTYIECRLETGRTHQIRVHMAHIGHPVLGDEIYGPKKCPFSLQGQTLHAMILGFVHPASGEYMEFTAPLPEYFEKLLERLKK